MTAVRLKPTMLEALDSYAKAEGLGRSDAIREAIAEYLDRRSIEVPAA